MTVTPHQIDLIQQSFDRLKTDLEPHSLYFYEALFRHAPHTRKLFRDDLAGQGMKFMTTLGRIINDLATPDVHHSTLQSLGETHARLGVHATDFSPMEEALIDTIRNGLGEDCTPELETAWRAAFGKVAERMITQGHIPTE